MAPFRVQLTRSAEKELRRLPKQVVERFGEALDQIAQDPVSPRAGIDIRKLRWTRATWRLRWGDHRGIYEIEGKSVVFTRFAHRSKVYDV
jgi:mRNA-degrading endonuclease RelE of RelBE toxin-antitoxin system